jgi:NADH-quinone oxidoreductase subunit C
MNFPEIAQRLKARFEDQILEVSEDPRHQFVGIDPAAIVDTALYLRDNHELRFNSLMCLSGVDYPDTLCVVYHLHSMEHRHKLAVKVKVSKESPEVPTVEGVWRAANWHERECYDLLGVRFKDHSDLRRILLPDDWEGHPLRKDYAPPASYRGIPTRAPYDVQSAKRKAVAEREAVYKKKMAEEKARKAAETAKAAEAKKESEEGKASNGN